MTDVDHSVGEEPLSDTVVPPALGERGEGVKEQSHVSFAEDDDPSREATTQEMIAAAVEAETAALAAKLEKKKSKLQAMLARKQAREEAERRQQEMEAKLNQQMITASVELLTFTKTFFGLIEVFPRQQCVVSCSSLGDDDDDTRDETTRGEGSVTKLVMTPSFLIHGVETLLARLGILLQKRVGPGGFVAVERHRTILHRVIAEYPKDVVTLMLNCLKLFVVPPPFAKADKLPFNFTMDDDVWEQVSASTREWLELVQVNQDLFDVDEYRLLLDQLSAYHLSRLTRVVRMLTRDLVTVYASAHTAKSVLALDEDVTKTIHHHGAPQSHLHRTARTPLASPAAPVATPPAAQSSASVLPADDHVLQDFILGSEAKAMRPCSSSSSRVESGGLAVSSTPLRNQKGKVFIAVANSASTPAGARSASRASPVPAQTHEICAKGVETPLRFSDYTRLAPANYAALSRDEDVLLGAQALTYGIVNNTEPPVPQTQCRSVLQLPHSHFLGIVHEIPQPNPAAALTSVKSLTLPKQNAAGKPRKQDARRLYQEALATHVKANGTVRIADAATVREHAKRRGQLLSVDEKEALMYSLPDGPKLVEAQRTAAHVSGHKLRKKPVVGAQRSAAVPITLPLTSSYSLLPHSTPGSSSGAMHDNSLMSSEPLLSAPPSHHLVLPLDSALLQRALATERASSPTPGNHSPRRGALTQLSETSPTPSSRHLHLHRHQHDKKHHGHAADTTSSPGSMRDAMTPPCLRNVFLTTSQREARRTRSIALEEEHCSSPGSATTAAIVEKKDIHDGSQQSQSTKARVAAAPRASPRYSTLLSLVGKSQRGEGESLTEFWEKLQGLEFKLSVLRGSGSSMPPHERQLWQDLWADCHHHIEEVFVILKQQALSKRRTPSPANSAAEQRQEVIVDATARECTSAGNPIDESPPSVPPCPSGIVADRNRADLMNDDAQQLAVELTCSVVDESIRLHLAELHGEYRRRFEEGLAATRGDAHTADITLDNDDQAPECHHGRRPRNFAAPIVRTYRRSALDKLFDEHGVEGLQMWLERSSDKSQSSAKPGKRALPRPARINAEQYSMTTSEYHSRIAAPKGGGLLRRSGHLQPLSNHH